MAIAPAEKKEDNITSERLKEEIDGEEEVQEISIDGEVIRPDKEQIAINAARKKGKTSKPKNSKKKNEESISDTLKEKSKQQTLDAMIEDKAKGRRRK